MIIYKKFFFDAAHYMPSYPKEHRYGRIHGHTYEVIVKIEGDVDNKNNWVINYEDLDSFVEPLLKVLDHKTLNEIEGLEKPTSENLARWFWNKLKINISNLYSVKINRPRIGGCEYKGEN